MVPFLDPAIQFPNPTAAANLEPLLVNTAGSWDDRPDAATRILNLYLASDRWRRKSPTTSTSFARDSV